MIRSISARLPGETASFDAQMLLAHITGRSRAWLLSHPEYDLTPVEQKFLDEAVQKLQDGIPLPYILGHWGFFGMDFLVTEDVLIPRPETELLVETALAHFRSQPKATYRFLDVGTGSGIIPISLATFIPQALGTATDISAQALKIAALNANRNGVANRLEFFQADLLPEDIQLSNFDLITANLPYIPTQTLKTLPVFGREPALALDGGIEGLDLISRLLTILGKEKIREALILLEIENRQGLPVRLLARQAFPDADIKIQKDLAGYDRLAVINT